MFALRRLNIIRMGLEAAEAMIINTQSKCTMTSYTCKIDQCVKDLDSVERRTYEVRTKPTHSSQIFITCFSLHFNQQDAIVALNGLQTNANTVKESIGRAHNTNCLHIKETEKYLNRIGVLLSDLDKLSVIHVAGTKGKGSTCALVESMLRHLNVKTGFYSSPHLVNVTERIRLNGQPITKELFSQYFWKVYSTLERAKVNSIESKYEINLNYFSVNFLAKFLCLISGK